MSKKGDFLSGFSGGNTQKPLTEQNTAPVKESFSAGEKNTDIKKGTGNVDIATNKRLADKIVADAERKAKKPTATRPTQSSSAIIKAPEHVVTKDEKFHQRKLFRFGIIGLAIVIIAIIIFFIFRIVNTVEVPNWQGRNISEAVTWGTLEIGAVEIEHEYSLEYDEDIIIAQSRDPGSNMSRNANLALTVSQGPDMTEEVDLPEFEEMTRAQIRTWADEYLMRGISFREENNADVEANHVIRVEFPSAVDPERFRRSDSVTIYVSTGPEMVSISNLIGNDREEVDEFITENPLIVVETEYEPHETIEHGTVLAQDPAPGTRLAAGETLTLTLSGGNPVVVPNFADMRRADAESMAEDSEAELKIVVHRRWNATIPTGRFVSQSIDAGEELFGEMPTVIVVYSDGRPWLPDLRRTSVRDLESTIIEINDKGSSITIDIVFVDSYEVRGTIIGQTRHNQFVAMDDHIIFNVSLENLDPPPDYVPPDPPGDDQPMDDPNDDEDWDFDEDFDFGDE